MFCEASYNGKHTFTNKFKIFVTNQLTHVSIFNSVYVYSYKIDPNFLFRIELLRKPNSNCVEGPKMSNSLM